MSDIASTANYSFARNLWYIASFELTRVFRTKRGLIALAAFSFVWFFIFKYAIINSAQIALNPSFRDFTENVLGGSGFEVLLQWPVSEVTAFWLFASFLFPLFCLFITADQLTSDKARGTLRFLTLRTSKESLLFGRFLGQVLVLTILILATLLVTLLIAAWRDSSMLSVGIISAIPIAISLLVCSLPFVALMSLCSLIANTPRSASFIAIILLGCTFIAISLASYYIPSLSFLLSWFLGAQIKDQLLFLGFAILNQASLPIVQTAVLLAIAQFVFRRADI